MTTPSASPSQPVPPPIATLDPTAADGTGGLERLAGCYLVRLEMIDPLRPASDMHYDGTLRISTADAMLAVSGDLYVHRNPSGAARTREPDPADGIPVFARTDYRFYMRGITLRAETQEPAALRLDFELYAYQEGSGTWKDAGLRSATLQPVVDGAGEPVAGSYEGPVRSPSGEVSSRLMVTHVSASLRRAVVELDRVGRLERPLDNGVGTTWQTVFDLVGWDLTVEKGDSNVSEPSGEFWSDAELHEAMLRQRRRADLDSEWRYHILCVRRIRSTDRGLMYDNGATDSNDVPREGVGIGTGWIAAESFWGPLVGRRFGEATSSYFRTALHEIGHAMGLQHNTVDFGVMNTTDVLARRATQPAFPENALWNFAANDRHRLRHLPDPWVRPGGIPFGQSFASAPLPDEAIVDVPASLQLHVEPLLEVLPLGAPARVEFRLSNRGKRSVEVPATLNVRGGAVRGRVIDPAGTARTFLPLISCIDAENTRTLKPKESVSHAITLLRGGSGALFPMPGVYRIVLDVTWSTGQGRATVSAETSVMITGPETHAHAVAAHRMLTVPNAMLTLVLGGDHLTDGVAAIQSALSCEQLSEHVAWIEAKRLAVPFFDRPARLEEAVDLLDDRTVMSQAEISRAARIVRDAQVRPQRGLGLADSADATGEAERSSTASDRLRALLQAKAKRPTVAESVRAEVDAL